MTIQTYRPSTRRASRKQLRLLDNLMQSRAHSPEDRAEYAAWLRDQPTTEQASRRIDQAYARINDPEHRAQADLADRLDRLSARCQRALDKHEKRNGLIDHAAEAQEIAAQLRRREEAERLQVEALAWWGEMESEYREDQPYMTCPCTVYEYAHIKANDEQVAQEMRAEAAQAQQEKPHKTAQGRFTTVDVPLVEGAAELWDC